jgi:hypothetical protein
MNLYETKSNDPKINAQRNLSGKTHYVDDDSLKFHKSRILRSGHTDNGLIFFLIESCALDWNNTKRGFRYVIFDVYGNTIDRPDLESSFKSHEAAKKAMWESLNKIDAITITQEAIEKQQEDFLRDIEYAKRKLSEIKNQQNAA